jgi:hypothetical protein
MSMDDLANKLSQRGIPQSSRSMIINSIIDHIFDNTPLVDLNTVTDKDVHSALSSIGQLSQNHPLIQQIQRGTDIKDPQLATQYTQHTVNAMKEHVIEHPERMRSIFKILHIRKRQERKRQGPR